MAAATTTVQMSEGTGTASAAQPQQTVVVVQQQVVAPPATPTRYAYGYYCIAIGIWHVVMTIIFALLTFAEGGWGALFMFCGFVPSLGTIIWMIMDASTKCCGKGSPGVTVCGCNCANAKWVLAVPMAVFAFLRIILYIVLFGHLADWMADIGDGLEDEIDTVFWIILFFAAWDDGPIITLAIDYWYQYAKNDDNGVMGTHKNPLRCVIAQAVVMFVASWSLLVVVLEYVGAGDVWAWVMHGIISSVVLLYGIFCAFTGVVEGRFVNTGCARMVWLAIGAAGGIGVIVVLIWAIGEAGGGNVYFYLWFYFYTAFSIPGVYAAFQFKVKEESSSTDAV